jgi:WD40 repeat protein
MNNYHSIFSIFVFLLLFFSKTLITSQEIYPQLEIKTSGAITDFFIENSSVVLSTDAGTIETYNVKSGQQSDFVQLPPMKDFMGDDVPTKIYSIDKVSDKLLVVTQGNHGFRNVSIFENGQQQEIFNAKRDKMMIKKARWINHNIILLGLMCNDLILFDVGQKKVICEISISPYTFSDFSLSAEKKYVFTADESGIVHKIEVNNCGIIQEFTGINVDNIYQIVSKNGVVITAGQDRRVGVYNTITNDNYFLQKDFLVYSVGLNGDGSIGACSATEDNKISIFNTASRNENCVLSGHESVVTKMAFFDDHTFISAGDDQYLMIWKIE